MKDKQRLLIILTGLVAGVLAVFLTLQGNPANMGFCIACFLRDTAGGLKLHSAGVVQYVRPEIIGLVLGSFLLSIAKKEFQPRGGSSPMTRFILGFFVMIGALMFLGCPFRMVLRMAGGDLNAWVGLIGFIGGVFLGTFFLQRGFSLKRTQNLSTMEGLLMPLIQVGMLLLLALGGGLLAFSTEGPGAAHAPILFALAVALVIGALAQRSRICQAGGFRDLLLVKDPHLFWGSAAMFVGALVMNLIFNKFNLGFEGQPIAHTNHLWNILGLGLVGFGSTLLGGCPMRQLILSGTGNTDSATTVFGMIIGAAFAHNFGLASSGAGPTANGMVAVLIGYGVLTLIAFMNIQKAGRV